MKGDDQNSSSPAASDDALAQLIRTAGRRESPPAQAYERTLLVTTQVWRRKVWRRRSAIGAIAASVLVTLAVAWQTMVPKPLGPQIARIDRIVGAVETRSPTSAWTPLQGNTGALREGMSIKTGTGGGAGLLLDAGHSLRMAEATEARLLSKSHIELIAGKAYVATLKVGAPSVALITRAGTATDVGTQFEVQYRDDRYRLRVREGAVMLRRDSQQIHSAAGAELVVEADGRLHRSAIGSNDPEWDWVDALAPTLDIDDQPVTVLLNWVARETGRTIRFADAATQRRAETTRLHGSIDNLTPLQALSIMLDTTDLKHRLLEDGAIMIEAR